MWSQIPTLSVLGHQPAIKPRTGRRRQREKVTQSELGADREFSRDVKRVHRVVVIAKDKTGIQQDASVMELLDRCAAIVLDVLSFPHLFQVFSIERLEPGGGSDAAAFRHQVHQLRVLVSWYYSPIFFSPG